MPVSEKKRITNDRYSKTCDLISLHPFKPVGAQIRAAAEASGQSLQGYILQAIFDQMERDGTPVQKEV